MKTGIQTIAVLGLVLVAALFVSGCLSSDKDAKDLDNVGMMSFKSDKEMKAYLENISAGNSRLSSDTSAIYTKNTMTVAEEAGADTAAEAPQASGGKGDYSTTNVQIAGVDEADLIKTDGKIIYYTPNLYYPTNVTYHADEKYPYYTYDTYQITYVINALPAETSSIISDIVETGGSLYLFNDTLITIKTGWEDSRIVAYDVADPASPVKLWEQFYDGFYTDSRMINGTMYLVTREHDVGVYPVMYMGKEVAAADCYYPYGPGIILPDTDVSYFVSKVDLQTGSFDKTVALMGSYSTILFASDDNLYLTNHYYPDTHLMYLDFVTENGKDYFPSDVMRHIKKVTDYDLSDRIKYMAVSEDIGNYFSTLDENTSSELSEKFYNDYNTYSAALIEEAEKTTITKISMESFDIVTGFVPGRIISQFSMDENGGNLRVVSAKGDNRGAEESQTKTVVTVFDSDMEVVGTLEGLAAGEEVRSTRYIGNTLYITTYAENDPFLVVDLSDPENPKELGKMQLTGSYSYLYPINDTLIVGFGTSADWRDWRIKLSLYDVSDPIKPVELDTFYFAPDEYTNIYDYHGFTWNAARNLMIVPGAGHAYVFEIKDGEISLVKDDDHGDASVLRSVYIGDNLYVFSDKEVHVYDMNSWQRVQVIPITQPVYPTCDPIYPIH